MSKMNDPVVTQSMLDRALHKQSKSIVDEISGIIDIFATQIDDRFNKLEKRMDRMEKNMEQLTRTIDGFVKRIDDYEQENVARDNHLARLDAWVQQIAKETGVKLRLN